MPMRIQTFPGERVADFVRRIANPVANAPSNVTVTVAAAGASAGANTIPVAALPQFLPRYTILVFDDANTTAVVTVEDAEAGATEIQVERVEGKLGEGIENALTDGDAATWNALYRLTGGESKDFNTSKQTEDNRPVTFESWTAAAGMARKKVTGKEASVAHSGFYHIDDAGFREVREADAVDGFLWYRREIFRADGTIAEVREGVVQVLDYTEPTSATDEVKASFTLDFYGEYTETYYEPGAEGDGDGDGDGG